MIVRRWRHVVTAASVSDLAWSEGAAAPGAEAGNEGGDADRHRGHQDLELHGVNAPEVVVI